MRLTTTLESGAPARDIAELCAQCGEPISAHVLARDVDGRLDAVLCPVELDPDAAPLALSQEGTRDG